MPESERNGAPAPQQPELPAPPSLRSLLQPPPEDDKFQNKPSKAVWLGLLAVVLFGLGVYDVTVSGRGDNACQMTYMYEYPQYVALNMTSPKAQGHSSSNKYQLWAYAEGQKMTDAFGKKKPKVNGIPVLFIPGNSGSGKQVRSLASVALRKALDSDGNNVDLKKLNRKVHFDFYALDFDEELSAVSGAVLQDQTDFAVKAINHIAGLYKAEEGHQTSVVLVGHSIGGVVAKSVFLSRDFRAGGVPLVISMATPHAAPVVVMDAATSAFYHSVDAFWSAGHDLDVTLVSIGGGDRDIQVRAGLTRISSAASVPEAVNVVSTAIPGAWVSADHRCVVWCKQVVLAVVRALFDCVDKAHKGPHFRLSSDAQLRNDVFRYHLTSRSAGKEYRPLTERHPLEFKFDPEGHWSDIIERQYVFQPPKAESNDGEEDSETSNAPQRDTYLMIRALDDPKHKQLTVDAMGMDLDNWVYGCKASSVNAKGVRVCDTGINLSQYSYILPSAKNAKRKTVTVNMEKLRQDRSFTHIVVVVPAAKTAPHRPPVPRRGTQAPAPRVRVHVDVYDPKERAVRVDLPRWMYAFLPPTTLIERTAVGAVRYKLLLKDLEQPWQAYTVRVQQLECQQSSDQQQHYGLMRLVTPWANDTTQTLIGPSPMTSSIPTNSLTVKLNSPKLENDKGRPYLEFFLNPECRHKVTLKPSIPAIWGQIARYYAPLLVAFLVSDVIVAISFQTQFLGKDGVAYNLVRVMAGHVTPMATIMPANIIQALAVPAITAVTGLALTTDFKLLADQGIDSGVFLYIVLFLVAHGLTLVVAAAAWISILAFGSLAHKSLVKLIGGGSAGGEVLAEAAISGAEKFPIVISGLLLALAFGGCGSLALCVGTFINFVHLFGMYKDHLDKLLKKSLDLAGNSKLEINSIDLTPVNAQFSNALLWVCLLLLNAPTLITWTKTAMTSPEMATTMTSSDPSLLPAIVASLSMPFLWGERFPDAKRDNYAQLSSAQRFMAVLVTAFATVSVYRVNYFVCAVLIANVVHRLLAPVKPEKTEEQAGEEEKQSSQNQSHSNNSLCDEDGNGSSLTAAAADAGDSLTAAAAGNSSSAATSSEPEAPSVSNSHVKDE